MKKKLIIQTSPYRTASTLLINALYGLIDCLYDKPIIYCGDYFLNNFDLYPQNDIIVVKSHNTNIDILIDKFGLEYDLFFVCSERKELELFIDEKYKSYPNVIIFSFEELNETSTNDITNIIYNICHKLDKVININLNITNGFNRIIQMNKRYLEISHMDFYYVDKFFEIHGSHRNRNKFIEELNLLKK
jgi:hypothetical protein